MTFVGFVTLTAVLAEGGAEALARRALAGEGLGQRVEVRSARLALPADCRPVSAAGTSPTRSGVAGFSVVGRDSRGGRCAGEGWARVRVIGQVWVAARVVRGGEALGRGAVRREDRELVAGTAPLGEVPAQGLAAYTIPEGTILESRHVRPPGLVPGSKVTVVVQLGDLRVSQQGIVLACAQQACARLASGRRVEGALVNGVLEVSP